MHMFHCRVMHQFEDIGPLEGISSGEDENGRIQLRNIVEELFRFCCAEFQWVTLGLRTRPAVKARQIAGASGLPDYNKRGAVQIEVGSHGARVSDRVTPAL